MKVIVDVKKESVALFIELVKSLNFVNEFIEINDKKKGKLIKELFEGFNDIHQHKNGKKKLKSGKELINEL